MPDPTDARAYPTPGTILIALIGIIAGALSLAYNPLFATSVIAVLLGVVTLRGAFRYQHYLVQGMLRIIGVLAIMAGLGGAVALAFPGLGVDRTAFGV